MHSILFPLRIGSLQPMIRKGDKWQPVTWDDAISFIAESLQRISEEHGPDSIGGARLRPRNE